MSCRPGSPPAAYELQHSSPPAAYELQHSSPPAAYELQHSNSTAAFRAAAQQQHSSLQSCSTATAQQLSELQHSNSTAAFRAAAQQQHSSLQTLPKRRTHSECFKVTRGRFCKHFAAPTIAGPTASSPQN